MRSFNGLFMVCVLGTISVYILEVSEPLPTLILSDMVADRGQLSSLGREDPEIVERSTVILDSCQKHGDSTLWQVYDEDGMGNQPFWVSDVMKDEPVLFIQEAGASKVIGKLLFTPTVSPCISRPDGSLRYEENRDYIWNPGSRIIELTATTRIPFKTSAEMAPGQGKPHTLNGVLFSEGRFFHDLQMLVSYEHCETWKDFVSVPSRQLVRSMLKLRQKKPFKIVGLGDSITEGYNASGFGGSKAPPNQPPYVQLVADKLKQRFEAPVTLKNLGIAGKTAPWGIEMADKVTREEPDLVILAFGMNDRVPPEQFESTMRQLIKAIQTGTPGADIVVVSPITDNPTVWTDGRIIAFRDALRTIELPNVLMADVTTPWLKLLDRKPFSSLSGNNINHPNDFGHQLYADVICSLFEN